LPPKPCTLSSPLPCVPQAPPTSFALTWSAWWYLGMSTNYEVPHCATSSILPSPFKGRTTFNFWEKQNVEGRWMLKSIFCIVKTPHEPLHSDKTSLMQ
jgi:hypothetical protein